jgi:sortase (surface protein transpeptidase)
VIAVRGIGIALLVGTLAGCSSVSAGSASPPVAVTPSPTAKASAAPAFHSVRSYSSVPAPVRLRIPSKGIDSALQRLGLAADGTIAAPTKWQVAGWYDKGPRPGQAGPAVIVGHIDSRSGPAVFFRLPQLRPGDVIYVDRTDGSTARFKVTTHRQFPKNQFPADLVYSPTLKPSLLLITCGGTFDHTTGHYRDNIVVSAVPG